ncbi:MAG: sulfatase-like hydrolase/transferase, partial [Chloroflexi bacterium]|nr:sulfatase-like hydrolase/transferase [Chloroflexota bacterium]
LLEDAIDWIVDEVANLANPFFGYFHLLPPHEPYRPRRDFVGIFQNDDYQPLVKPTHFSARIIREQRFLEQKRLEYDEFLAFTDAEFGRLYDTLQRWDLLENSYLIVTSDHGQLFERGVHGHNNRMLFEPLLHVPLLIARPGQNKREDIFDNTSNVDLLPTILHITGQPIPSELEGQILPNFAPNSSVGKQRSIFALEAKSNPKSGPLNNATIAIIKEQYKLVHYIGDYTKRFELFDLSNDPEEMNDLFERNLAITAVLQEELDEKIRSMD